MGRRKCSPEQNTKREIIKVARYDYVKLLKFKILNNSEEKETEEMSLKSISQIGSHMFG